MIWVIYLSDNWYKNEISQLEDDMWQKTDYSKTTDNQRKDLKNDQNDIDKDICDITDCILKFQDDVTQNTDDISNAMRLIIKKMR
jgi:septal ring factor EnvC (AmiA/AmiB activator)